MAPAANSIGMAQRNSKLRKAYEWFRDSQSWEQREQLRGVSGCPHGTASPKAPFPPTKRATIEAYCRLPSRCPQNDIDNRRTQKIGTFQFKLTGKNGVRNGVCLSFPRCPQTSVIT